MKPLADCRLYTFVDTAYLHGRSPADLAKQLCDGGSDLIQVRAKNAPVDEVSRLTEAVLEVTSAAGVWLVVNDHPEIARELGAPICHLGQEDFFDAGYTHISELTPGGGNFLQKQAKEAKSGQGGATQANVARVPTPSLSSLSSVKSGESRLLFGLSTHAPDQAQRAVAAGPDYIAIGPVFPTPTKPGRPAVTLEYVRWAAANVTIPWFAIGGITQSNLDQVLEAGAKRICIVSAILNAPNVTRACLDFRKRLTSAL
ncbi:MAG TPA: thiamine phosphate synthase [Roseimicrobium sp.]|nr:thiamine phosphate synthase [Roseimicrobium sp.]